MIKLIFTTLTLTAAPGAPPTATSSTVGIDFASPEACARVLEGAKRQGEHTVNVRGVSVTLRFAGGKCVADGAGAVAGPPPSPLDPLGLFGR